MGLMCHDFIISIRQAVARKKALRQIYGWNVNRPIATRRINAWSNTVLLFGNHADNLSLEVGEGEVAEGDIKEGGVGEDGFAV